MKGLLVTLLIVVLCAACSGAAPGPTYTMADVTREFSAARLVITEQHERSLNVDHAAERLGFVVQCEAAVECEPIEIEVYRFDSGGHAEDALEQLRSVSDCVWQRENIVALAFDCHSLTVGRVQGAIYSLETRTPG